MNLISVGDKTQRLDSYISPISNKKNEVAENFVWDGVYTEVTIPVTMQKKGGWTTVP